MIKNYLKTFIRSLKRNKVYSLINIAGLAVGMTCAIILYLYIHHELGYDLHYKNAERIYRVEVISSRNGIDTYHSNTARPYGPALQKDYSEVEAMAHIRHVGQQLLEYGKVKLYTDDLAYVNVGFFQVFNYKFIKGNPKTALEKSHTIVLTKTMAKKVFGRVAEAINKPIQVNQKTYTVTGVIEDIPTNSHLSFDGLLSTASFNKKENHYANRWGNFSFYTYIKLRKGVDYKSFEKKTQEMRDKYMQPAIERFKETYKIVLFPLIQIHLYSTRDSLQEGGGAILYIYIFSTTAIFILLIACVNYMNLATARSVNRSKEVGIRKVVGSYRSQLIGQFLFEAFFTVLSALIISLVLAEAVLPFFNSIASKQLSLHSLLNSKDIMLMLGLVVLVSLLSGSYPAFVLSSFRPVLVLKGKFGNNSKGVFLRKGLVIFQFSISITMIISTWMVYKQLNYVHKKDVGYDKAQVVSLPLRGSQTRKQSKILRQELLKHPHILHTSTTGLVPTTGTWSNGTYNIERPDKTMLKAEIDKTWIDAHYLETMGIKLLIGRNFSKTKKDKNVALVNETLAKMLGWKSDAATGKFSPLGKTVATRFDKNGKATYKAKVIGVVKDFHTRSLHKPVEPMVMRNLPEEGWYTLVRINPENLEEVMEYMKKTWAKIEPVFPFQPTFLNKSFDRQYRQDERRGTIFLVFSGLTIFIACLGLFGLVSFTVQQRTKEIGVRKVLGANEQSILKLISHDFVILILIANLLAFPAAYFVVSSWLQNFAYKTPMSIMTYFLAGGVALLIALFTISLQALRATKVNPVDVLKYE